MTEPLNAKGRPFSWSHTAVKDFEGCPRRYAEGRFYCRLPFVESEAMKWGNKVHKAAEMLIKGQGPIDQEALKPVEKYATAMIRSGNPIESELKITLTRDLKPTGWFAKDAWLRCAIDVVLMKLGDVANLYDFKTGGKIRAEEDQLILNAAALSVVRPKVKLFRGSFIWTAHQEVTPIRPVTKDEIPTIWAEYMAKVKRIEEAWKYKNFPARKSGLCPYCGVTSCEYWRPLR